MRGGTQLKTTLRILVSIVLLTIIGIAWQWKALAATPLGPLAAAIGRVLDASFFNIGNLPVTPLFVLKAIVYLTLLSLSSHLVRKILRDRILTGTSLDEGLKYALSVSAGYLVFFVGATIGLQSLGLDLSSIAFLGGAVGLGIGVGLQAIVNNFISGLILLAERPIKVGNRVEIEDLTGDVVQIAARAAEGGPGTSGCFGGAGCRCDICCLWR